MNSFSFFFFLKIIEKHLNSNKTKKLQKVKKMENQQEVICAYDFMNMFHNVLYTIANNSIEDMEECINPVTVNMALLIAKNVFLVEDSVVNMCKELYGVELFFEYYENYDEFQMVYIDVLHEFGLNGLSHVLNKLLRASQSKNVMQINWKYVLNQIELEKEKNYLKSGLDCCYEVFNATNQMSSNLKKIYNLLDAVNKYDSTYTINFSKIIKKFEINEKVISECITFCVNHEYRKAEKFLNSFFLLLVRIESARNFLTTSYGAGLKRSNPYVHHNTKCNYKVSS